MLRGPLSEPDARTRFAGHETFPLRRLWLRKAFDAVKFDQENNLSNTFDKDAGIIRFGVGKNMVAAIKHWALLCGIIQQSNTPSQFKTSEIGEFIFNENIGVDPFLEDVSTLWLLHWLICKNHEVATTWYYAFSQFNARVFDRETLVVAICDLIGGLKRSNASPATIKRDVECFVRTYVSRLGSSIVDDQVECLLGELGILKEISSRSFEFQRGPKPTLHPGVFAFALADFWEERETEQATLSIEAITFEPGSPGRIFKLDESSISDRLTHIEEETGGLFVWTDTAGVRNIAKRGKDIDKLELLRKAYSAETSVEVAA